MLPRLIILSIFSGLCLFLSWPPNSGAITFLIFIGFVPLFIIEDNIEKKNISYAQYFCLTYLAFFIFNILTTFWISNAHIAGAIFAILCNSLFMAIVFFMFSKMKNIFKSSQSPIILLILWLSFEYLHLNWDLSWPWLTLGNVFASHPEWIQWYSITGVLGGSCWILVINILIFRLYLRVLCKKNLVQNIILILLMLFVPLLISIKTYNNYNVNLETQRDIDYEINVLVVQPNINPYTEKFLIPQEEQLDSLIVLIEPFLNRHLDYIVLPETFLVAPVWEHLFFNNSSVKRLNTIANKFNFNIVMGATTLGFSEKTPTAKAISSHNNSWYQVYNSAIFLDGSTNLYAYHKSKLVPGAEQMPFQHTLYPILGNRILNIGDATSIGNFSKQDSVSVFDSNIASVICYESIYGEYVTEFIKKGAQVIFIITNDGWWKETSGFKQHSMYAVLRAIETRRYIARSANTGVSSVINPSGKIINRIEWDKKGVINANIRFSEIITFYTKHGDYLGRVSSFLSCLFLLYFIVVNKLRF